MSYDAHKNFAVSTVSTPPAPATTGTSLTVASGDGAKFPAAPFNAVVCPSGAQPTTANAEIVRVTNIATDTFTITRTQEGTSARSIGAGDQIFAAVTAKSLTDIEVPSGLLDLSTSTAGQIKFPATQNPSANANTLDDYEEGTWTPTIGGTGGQSGQTYTVQQGDYVKIGKLVILHFNVTLSAKGTITSIAQIQGLPFTVENVAGFTAGQGLGFWTGLTSSFVYISAIPVVNTTTASLFGTTAAATGLTSLAQGDLSNVCTLSGTLSYRASA